MSETVFSILGLICLLTVGGWLLLAAYGVFMLGAFGGLRWPQWSAIAALACAGLTIIVLTIRFMPFAVNVRHV